MFLLSKAGGPWDLAIVVMLATGFAVLFICARGFFQPDASLITRFFIGCMGLVTLTCTALVLYGSFIEPRLITVTRFTVPLPVSEPLKVVVLGDPHLGAYKDARYLERVVDRVNGLLPDLVLLVGDYTLDGPDGIQDLDPLADLHPVSGTFAVLGNHDYGKHGTLRNGTFQKEDISAALMEKLTSLGIPVLVNQHQLLTLGDQQIAIAGTSDAWSGFASVSGALLGVPGETPTILLAHNPDVILDKHSRLADLIVSGHTHGGQLTLPYLGPIAGIPTEIDHRYLHGVYALENGTQLAITRGIGESGPRARLFAPPEIMLLMVEPKHATP